VHRSNWRLLLNDKRYMTTIICEVCGEEKVFNKYDVARGRGKFCSRKCSNRSRSKYNGKRNRNESNIQYKADKPQDCPVEVVKCLECYLKDCNYKGAF
jgi:hypothetical protein